MSLVIGVDVGSTAIKAVVWDGNEVLDARRVAMPGRIATDPSYYEHDPIAVRDATFELIRQLASGHDITGIAFTGQMHGGLVTDRELNPVTNFATWQDRRENAALESLRAVLGNDPTGAGIHPGYLVATVAWWKANKLLPLHGYALGIYDWFASIVAGQPVTDIGSAAAWGMYDPIDKHWREAILQQAGISNEMLPIVYQPGASIGPIDPTIAKSLGISSNAVVCAGCGDTQATYIGSGCKTGDVLLNFGTGSQSMWETSQPVKSSGVDVRYLTQGRYLATSPTEAGGEAYRILAEFYRDVLRTLGGQELSLDAIFERMNAVALEDDDTGKSSLTFDPAFGGSKVRTVHVGGSLLGLTRENFHASEMIRAILQGMVAEIWGPYRQRESENPKRIIGAGSGMRKNPALRMIAEQKCGQPVHLAPSEDEAALGAAKLCNFS